MPPKRKLGFSGPTSHNLEGSPCNNCRSGTYSVRTEKTKGGLGKAFLSGFLSQGDNAKAREMGFKITKYRCKRCGHEIEQ